MNHKLEKAVKSMTLTSFVLLVIIARMEMPSGFYTFLRIVVCATSILLFYITSKKTEGDWNINAFSVVFGLVAILFNPIIPIYLYDKDTWQIIDNIVGVSFLLVFFFLTSTPSR